MTPCIGCQKPTDGEPSICRTCAHERATHQRSKRICRAEELRDRLTKEGTPMSTKTPATRVQSYDWSRAAQLPEFAALAEALDAFVHAAHAYDVTMSQDAFLNMVRDVATGLGYADMCSTCYELAHPFAVDVADDGWSLRGTYQHCGRTWTCGYAVSAPEWFQ